MKTFQFVTFRIKLQQVLRISFDKIDGFIVSLDGKTKHLILFDYVLLDKICYNSKYIIIKKSGINYNSRRIRINSYKFLPIKKRSNFL